MNSTNSIPIFNTKFEIAGYYDSDLFNIEPDHRILSEVVRWQLANRRLSIQSVKNRSMTSGAHRKLYRQKGTGRARQGDGKACHFRGGGAAFKLINKVHSFKLNKKFKKLALKMILSDRKHHISLVDNLADFDLSKTKDYLKFIDSIVVKNHKQAKKVLFLTDAYQEIIASLRGSKNVHNVSIIPVANFNVLASAESSIITDVKSMKLLEERLS